MNRAIFRSLLISSVVLPPLFAASPVMAALETAPLTTPLKAERSYTASLQDATRNRAVRTLDWRTPAIELRFDLSQADIINTLSVTLSADPLPGVDPSTPLLVQFNNGRPTPIETRGKGFDATVTLDHTKVRATGNVLRLSYAAGCTGEGGYTVNLDESEIAVSARPKNRRLQLREVERRLAGSAFAPQTVGLIATGESATHMEALGAQAIGLRMDRLPDFRTSVSGTDFNLVMVPRSSLFDYTDEADILSGTGPRIALSREYPNRLFLTGDTDAEVLQSVRAFASAYLPQSRRSITSPGELAVQSPLGFDRMQIDGTARLDRLSVKTGALREYTFDVADPAASQGDLVLRLTRDSQTEPGARMKAVLNGVSLGEATLDGRRKTVAYPIRPGLLMGSQNRLELTTKPSDSAPRCEAVEPFIAIGSGSKIRLSVDRPSAPSDLSRFAADGSIFSRNNGAGTVIVLPDSDADFDSALSVVARLAKASGQSWVDAEFSRSEAGTTDRNLLIIEPFNDIDSDIRSLAPRGLQSAWRGQPMDGENRLASVERFASLDIEETVRLAARQTRASGRITSGGVAAIYPGKDGQLVGVISNTPGLSFSNAIRPLASDAHWNGLNGGVTRWNDRAVVMAQTALPVPGLRMAELNTQTPGLPRLSLPDIDFNLVDPADLGLWLQDKWEALSNRAQKPSAPATPDATPAFVPPPEIRTESVIDPMPISGELNDLAGSNVPLIATPRLKPAVQSEVASVTPVAAPTSSEAKPAPTSVPKLRSSLEPRIEAKSGWRLPDVRKGLRRLEAKSKKLRADLRRKTGIKKPELKSLRIGTLEIVPAALLMAMVILLALVSLMVMSPTRAGGGD